VDCDDEEKEIVDDPSANRIFGYFDDRRAYIRDALDHLADVESYTTAQCSDRTYQKQRATSISPIPTS
jgi:hypothetical protein